MSRARLARAGIRGLVTTAGAPIADGRALISPAVDLTGTNVGPNALLKSGSYPAPSSSSPGPLTLLTPPVSGSWRLDGGSSDFLALLAAWATTTTPYVYNNSPSNPGGIVPSGGMLIDGQPVAAGTYVFQFFDFSLGSFILLSGGPSVLFRGCRIRAATTSPGFFNSQSGGYSNMCALHYCDFGAPGSAVAYTNAVTVQIAQAGAVRAYRNYVSYTASAFILEQGITGTLDVIENVVEKMTLFQPGYHLNGIKLQGGNTCGRILRNRVVFDVADELGNQLTQTDPVGLIQTDGNFPGTGTNPDGSQGYVIAGNVVGGGGYSMYLGSGGSVANLALTGNLVTTSAYATGGCYGPYTAAPTWGSNGNTKSGNVWMDGPSAGTAVL